MTEQGETPEQIRHRHIKVHESGHAIVGHAVGMHVTSAIANNHGPAAASMTGFSLYQQVMAGATFRAAGLAAEAHICGSKHPDHGADDLEQIEAWVRQRPWWTDDIRAAAARADELVVTNEAAIKRLRDRLGEAPPTVSGDELQGYFEAVAVNPPPRDPPAPAV